jgi:hypothetical protein
VRSVVAVLALTACGRIGFDPSTSTNDGSTSDARMGAPFTVELPMQSAISDVAVLTDGSVIAVGSRIGALTLDGVTDPGVGATDAVVIALDPTGRARWIHQHGGTENDIADTVAIAADGSIYVGGFVENTASLGGAPRIGQGRDAFLAKYEPDGDYVWNVGFGGLETNADFGDRIFDVEVAPDGDVIVVGYVAGIVDFGGGTTPASGSDSDAFIARYSPTGVFRWARRFGDTGTNAFVSVVATNDAIYAGGFYSGTPRLGSTILPNRGGHDAVMFRMSADGTAIQWVSNFGGPNNQRIFGVTLVDGALVGAGYYWDSVDLPGIPASSGKADGLVVRFADPGGAFVEAVRVGSANCEFFTSAHGSSNNVIVSGTFQDTIQLDMPVTSSGGADAIAFGLAGSSLAWHRALGNDTDDLNRGAAGTLETGLVVGGMHGAQLDVGCNPVEGASRGYVRRF